MKGKIRTMRKMGFGVKKTESPQVIHALHFNHYATQFVHFLNNLPLSVFLPCLIRVFGVRNK